MKEKERYLSPEIEVIKFHPQGVVCQSTVDANGIGVGDYNNPFGSEMTL